MKQPAKNKKKEYHTFFIKKKLFFAYKLLSSDSLKNLISSDNTPEQTNSNQNASSPLKYENGASREKLQNETKLEALATDKPTLKEKPVLVDRKMSNEYKMVSGQEKKKGICFVATDQWNWRQRKKHKMRKQNLQNLNKKDKKKYYSLLYSLKIKLKYSFALLKLS